VKGGVSLEPNLVKLNILGIPPTLYNTHFAPMERSSEGAQGLPV
jgi:hypothetical protein